jgi:predicted porin
MRNTKIALAVLALVASTAAMAQATVYGTVDLGVGKQSNQSTQLNHSLWSTSVFGIKASEELDGGLKAFANLEAGFNPALGNATGDNGGLPVLFSRQSNIGLAGEFGTVTAGTQLSPFIAAALGGFATDNASFYVPALLMNVAVSPATINAGDGAGGLTTVNTGGFFIPNAVSYTTPSIGGFSASALTQLSGNAGAVTPTGTTNAEKYSAYSASFTAGDVSISGGYEKNGSLAAALAGTATETTAYTIGGSYTMGPVRLAAGYIQNEFSATSKTSTYILGGNYAVNEKLSAQLNYARANNGDGIAIGANLGANTGQSVATESASIINVGLKYALSKRTFAYTTVSRVTNGAVALYGTSNNSTTGDQTGYAVGMSHSF